MFCKHLNVKEDEAKELIKLSVRMAREARDIFMKENPKRPRPLIAGSVGPYGCGRYEFIRDKISGVYNGVYVESVPAEVGLCVCVCICI